MIDDWKTESNKIIAISDYIDTVKNYYSNLSIIFDTSKFYNPNDNVLKIFISLVKEENGVIISTRNPGIIVYKFP
jgi:hypothetical protein